MAYTTIDDPEAYFQTASYTGNGAANNAITLPGDTAMQPDLVWIKNRDTTDVHCLFDAVRGATKLLTTSTAGAGGAETTDTDTLDSFTSDGFQVDADVKVNTDAEKYVAWCWKAGGSTSANTTGDIDSTVSLNSTVKFSIVAYEGNGTANQTVGHSLGVTPDIISVKKRGTTTSLWGFINPRFVSVADPNTLYQDTTAAETDDTNLLGSNAPSSTIFGIDDWAGINVDGEDFIAYCWASVQGFSSFGTYEGNADANGTFVFCGFRPAFVMTKSVDSTSSWHMFDNKREGYNPDNNALAAEDTAAEATTNLIDLLSTGFKFKTPNDPNVAETYIYLAFAEAPFVNSEGVPCNAR
jgi:hypothetical protein